MCNINILFRKTIKEGVVTPFIMAVTSHSFARNSHGEGCYISSNDLTFKSKNKINYLENKNDLEKSDLIVTHQRFSTSGFEVKFNHPFENEHFVMVHNGVINQFKRKEGSDTYGFWLAFNEEMMPINSLHTNQREDRLKKAINKLFKEDEGSYSIFIYDKKTKEAYYFKNEGTEIHFYKNKEYLFITTNDENSKFLSLLTEQKFVELDIKSRVIYNISKKEVYVSGKMPAVKKSFNEKLTKFYTTCSSCGLLITGEPNRSLVTMDAICDKCANEEAGIFN